MFCDFSLQRPYQYLNKGTYGHPGGILHAGIHSIGTFLVLSIIYFGFILGSCISFWNVVLLSLLDGVVHYHIDWAKVKICLKKDLKCNNSEDYWILLGFDQYLHYLTYVVIIMLFIA